MAAQIPRARFISRITCVRISAHGKIFKFFLRSSAEICGAMRISAFGTISADLLANRFGSSFSRGGKMLVRNPAFPVLAIIAAALGFGEIAGGAAGSAERPFCGFLASLTVSAFAGALRGRPQVELIPTNYRQM